MPASFLVRRKLCFLTLGVLCLPACFAEAELPAAGESQSLSKDTMPAQFVDVSLADRGLLTGRVLDTARQPKPQVDVTVYSAGQAVATTQTDARGVFAVAGLRGGVHHVAIPEACVTCRLWAPGTAPPAAERFVEIIEDQSVVRGQWGPPTVTNNFLKKSKVMATNPFVVGGVVAAAVAIPVALHNADEDDGPSS